MSMARGTSWQRRTWPLVAVLFRAVTVCSLASSTFGVAGPLRAAGSADSDVPDERTTKSGKPLAFHSGSALAWDRDDQAAAAKTAQRAIQQSASDDSDSTDQTGLLTQIRFAPTSPLGGVRKASYSEPVTATDSSAAPPAGALRPPVEPAPAPLSPNTPSDAGVIGGGGDQSPASVFGPAAGPALDGPGEGSQQRGLPSGAWPHGYLRQQLAEPLVGASWCNEPFHIDWFLGMIRGTEIIRDHVDQNVGVIGGSRLGWDYDLYWGLETRLGFASLQDQLETDPLVGSADKVILWDSSILYYPWGDSRWRPYMSVGLGLTQFQFTDDFDRQILRSLIEMPLGIGIKYRLHDWLTLRADVTDNLAFGSSGLETMNNFSFTTGMEYRFGGCHRSYWPWEPAGAH